MQRYATKPAPDVPKWSALLVEAVNKPGRVWMDVLVDDELDCHRRFLARRRAQG